MPSVYGILYLLCQDFHVEICSTVKKLKQPMPFSSQKDTRERWIKQREFHINELFLYSWKKGQADLGKVIKEKTKQNKNTLK